jgi:hypothetical protein
MAQITLRLTLDVAYDLNGEDPRVARWQLERLVVDAVNNGLLTGDTAMEVDRYRHRIEELKKDSA